MKLLKNLSIAVITLFIAFPCVTMEIDDEPTFDISAVDLNRIDDIAYLQNIYKKAPGELKDKLDMARIVTDAFESNELTRDIARYFNNDTEFAHALRFASNQLIQAIANQYPNLKYRIGTIANQTNQEINLSLEKYPREINIKPKESKNVFFELQNQITKILISMEIAGKSVTFQVFIQPTERNTISTILYSRTNRRVVDKTTFPILAWNNIYDINIVFQGEQLSDSIIEVSTPFDIFEAVKILDYDKLKEIIKMLGNILIQDKYGNTPLHYAALNDWSDQKTEQIFGYLLSVNPQLLTITNNEGETPLSLVPIEIRKKIQDLIEGKYVEKEE